MSERGRYSKSSSSMARSTAETGAPKVAAMPAAAPAASSVFRSAAVTEITWPRTEPRAPPVAMIGPSAPKGPPVPMATAAESGLRKVIRTGMRLSLARICSIASGMPWPRMADEPKRAINPTTSPPMGGTRTTHGPRWEMVGPSGSSEAVPRKDRFVTRKMSRWSIWATPAASRPTPTASAQMYAVRRLTFAACGAMFAWASPGPIDGATGSPSVVEPVLAGPSATAAGSRSRDPRSCPGPDHGPLVLEEHRRRFVLVDAHRADHPLQQALQLPALRPAQLLDGRDQICLGRAGGSGEEPLPRCREAKGGAACVVLRDGPYHQAPLGQALHHHRDRARIGERSPGELGHRSDGPLGQALEDEELCRAEAEPRLGCPIGEPEGADEPAQGAQGSGRGGRDFHGFPTNNTAGRPRHPWPAASARDVSCLPVA